MAKVLVLYHSMSDISKPWPRRSPRARAASQAPRLPSKRVPETMDASAFAAAGGKTDQQAEASPAELVDYDAIIFGTPTRFGNMSGQMRNFLDQTGGLWAKVHWPARWPASSPPPVPAADRR